MRHFFVFLIIFSLWGLQPGFAADRYSSLIITDEPFTPNAPKANTQQAAKAPKATKTKPQFIITPSPRAGDLVEGWRARKGEDVETILRRWSARAQHDLVWDIPQTPHLKSDFTSFGSFDEAVTSLLRANGLQPGAVQIRPHGLLYNDTPESQPVVLTPQVTQLPQTTPIALPVPPQAFGKVQRWRGLRGANLREVFEVWAEDAGVRLIWGIEHPLALQRSMNAVMPFSEAITEVLAQYEALPGRPVARLYTANPPTLVVHAEGTGFFP